MKAGTIRFNGADLALYGTPELVIRKTPEPAPPARCTHRRVDITVSIHLLAEMPSTTWRRAQALHSLLSSTPEGLLEVIDENGRGISWMACPGDSSLPQAIKRGQGRVDLSFTAIEPVVDASFPLSMSIDPLDGSPVIQIARPTDWSQSIRPSRPDGRLAFRDSIANTITFRARTAFADPTTDTATRAAMLMTKADELNALQGREVSLSFAGFSGVVQVESFTTTPSTGWEWIDLEAQVRSVALPGDTEAEVAFTVETAEDPAGDTRIILSGTIKAAERPLAEAKIQALLTAWNTTGRRVTRNVVRDEYYDGHDTEAPEWTGLSFTFEFSETPSNARYTLEITTRESADGHRTTYTGTVTARTLGELIAAEISAAGGKHPVETSAELRIRYSTDEDNNQALVQGTFTREYQTQATGLRATITRNTNQGAFGDWQSTLSGRISAATYEIARSAARAQIPSGVILRVDDESHDIAAAGVAAISNTQSASLSFTYTWGTNHTVTHIQYEDTETPDYTRMVSMRDISGTIWAPDESSARSALNAIITGLSLSNPTRSRFSKSRERQTSGSPIDRALSYRFEQTFEYKLTGTIGHDIIEAQFSLQRIGMVDYIPITEIPLNKPVTQITGGTLSNPVGYGHTIGRLTASGSVKARQRNTARNWGQAKRSSAASVSGGFIGAADPPDERMAETYAPFNGTEVTCYQFDFTYGFRYADGLTGLMT